MKTTRILNPIAAMTLIVATVIFCYANTSLADTAAPLPASEVIDINVQAITPAIPDLPKDKKSVKSFNHLKHSSEYLIGNSNFTQTYNDDFTCKACHLQADSPEQINTTPAGERLKASLSQDGKTTTVKKYFHGICLGCHKNMKKAEKTTGPTSCKGCHKRT